MTHRTLLTRLQFVCGFALTLFAFVSAEAAPQGAATTEAGPNAWRRNYAVVKAKLEAGENVRIGVMGGSIARGASTFPRIGTSPDGSTHDYSHEGATPYYSERHSMRAVFHRELQEEFAHLPGQVRMLNLCLGGSDTYEAAYRYQLNAASRDLDMLVLEFAVNDIWHARNSIDTPHADFALVRMIECVVRQAIAANPDIAILFVISTARDYYSDYDNPDLFRPGLEMSRQIHKSYAISRGIPYVDMTDVFFNGTVPDYVRLYEGELHGHNRVHMSPIGHRIAGEALFRVTKALLNNGYFNFGVPALDVPAQLEPWPIHPQILTPDQLTLTSDFQVEAAGEPVHATPVFATMDAARALNPRSMLDIPFQGSTVGIWWQSYFDQQGGSGRIGIWLDGVFKSSHARGPLVMPGDSGWPRFMHIGFGLDPNEQHLLQIGILSDQPPELRIALFGVLVGN